MDHNQNCEAYLRLIEGREDIEGRFTGLRHVGSGTFSLVFRAADVVSRRDVAIKVYRPDLLNETYRYQCFCREDEILRTLTGERDILEWIAPRSEFSVQVTTGDGFSLPPLRFPYFAVELAAEDVGSVVERGGWGTEQLLENFRAMCRAVQRIHSHGITHRDLKPGNFVLLHDGRLKLSDFGTARDINGEGPPLLPRYMFAPGDTRYTAPEMLATLHDEDPSVGFRADVYSLGAILFELCTGTNLGVQIFDQQFCIDLSQAMGNVRRGRRRQVYDQYVGSIANGHPLPDFAAFGGTIPPCVADRLSELYKAMAALDYRARLCDFQQIFLKIDQSLVVLRNEEKYRRWRERKDRSRRQREAKLSGRATTPAATRGTGALS